MSGTNDNLLEYVPRIRPKTPDNITSKNQKKKWRKTWDYQEKKRKREWQELHPSLKKTKKKQKKKKSSNTNKKLRPRPQSGNASKNKQKQSLINRISISHFNKSIIFSHLDQYETEYSIPPSTEHMLHPSVLRTGIAFADGRIKEDNERCHSMLESFITLISDFDCPSTKSFCREVGKCIKYSVQYFAECRPISIPMENTIKQIKVSVNRIDLALTNDEQRQIILQKLTDIQLKISSATKIIIDKTIKQLTTNDTIVVYGRQRIIESVIIDAYAMGMIFNLIIVDSRPANDGKLLLFHLSKICPNLKIRYILINGISNVISKNVSKVLFGVSSIMSNGAIVCEAGTAMIALLAHSLNIPVIVCCETYKFTERVQIDSIGVNEINDFDALVRDGMDCKSYKKYSNYSSDEHKYDKNVNGGCVLDTISDDESEEKEWIVKSELIVGDIKGIKYGNNDGRHSNPFSDKLMGNWRNIPKLKLLSLKYDIIPAKLVTMVVTEIGNIPPLTVPVVIREFHKDSLQ